MEGKLSFDDCQLLLKDYVMRSDFQYLMSNKVSIDEVKSLLNGKVGDEDLKSDLNSIYNKYDDWYRDVNKKLSACALQRDFDALAATVDLKASIAEVNEGLDGKANKQSVTNALQRKANKTDFEALLAQKVDAVRRTKL